MSTGAHGGLRGGRNLLPWGIMEVMDCWGAKCTPELTAWSCTRLRRRQCPGSSTSAPISCPMRQPPGTSLAVLHHLQVCHRAVFCLISAESTTRMNWEYDPLGVRAFYLQVDFHALKKNNNNTTTLRKDTPPHCRCLRGKIHFMLSIKITVCL